MYTLTESVENGVNLTILQEFNRKLSKYLSLVIVIMKTILCSN